MESDPQDGWLLRLSGDWTISAGLPGIEPVERTLDQPVVPARLHIDASGVGRWDSALVRFVMATLEAAAQRDIQVETTGLPEGARRLVEMALAVPERAGARRVASKASFLESVGLAALNTASGGHAAVTFLGECALMFVRFLTGRATFRRVDLWLAIQQCGAEALPIVTIISLLVGLILAFVGAVQLEQFGAEIYVADLVGIAMTREMAAIMTGIALAGRTGAAFAANIGTMQGNEEIDALQTLGISAMDFLVLPRMLALMLMMPLLTIYADAVGILGGWLVGVGMLDISSTAYLQETQAGVGLTNVAIGVAKGTVFGAVVAFAGCLRGLQCGRNAAAVGQAATSAVVTGIVWIIALDAVFAILTNILGI
ncbi:ABC transporter permease [Ferruginivarius sediminum]|uniref:MlaE family lipid ABC transporter permease subunit n=1 Tax=Ferruginivarius sediminum TaxID=2661937 RepID=A0A369T977_9PROT|nr:MlaE family lipid ABC transporter permease subunit [Ferruginivarius sediminum]RDD60925.1 MlaE family lipid ABC transporter permease subunit [Ferruginivarius sediminum]